MTQEKQQLDKIVELYNSGIEENINIAIETANNIFGINSDELEYMARIRGDKLIYCRISEEEAKVTLSRFHVETINKTTNISIKHKGDLPSFLTRIFYPLMSFK